jgi:hypothetical protein
LYGPSPRLNVSGTDGEFGTRNHHRRYTNAWQFSDGRSYWPWLERPQGAWRDEADSARIAFDVFPEELDQLQDLFKFRSRELVRVIQEA